MRAIRTATVSILVAVLALLVAPTVSTAEAGIDGATNAFRQQNGLAPLQTSVVLTNLAAQRAEQIVCESATTCNNFHHDFWWWGPSGCKGIGENIAYRGELVGVDWGVNAWINSPTHRANMLGDFDSMGSAMIVRNGETFFVQLFGKDCGGSAAAPAPVQHQSVATPAPMVMALPDTAMDR